MASAKDLTITIKADFSMLEHALQEASWHFTQMSFLLTATREENRRRQLRADLDRQGALPIPLRIMLAKWLPTRFLPTYATSVALKSELTPE